MDIYDDINSIYDEIYENSNEANPSTEPVNIDDIYDDAPPPIRESQGWITRHDANGNIFCEYIDYFGNQCTIWEFNDQGEFQWRCAGTTYVCKDIGIEGRAGVFLIGGPMVGAMTIHSLNVTWIDENNNPIYGNLNENENIA